MKRVWRLSKNDVENVMKSGEAFVSHFTENSYKSFVGVWETRLAEAIEIHKVSVLEKQARSIVAFAKERQAGNLHFVIYPSGEDRIPEVGFLYDFSTGDFLQTGPEYFAN